MTLTRNEVRECLIECLKEIAPDKDQSPLDEQADPMRKLSLDSHDGVNLACKLSEKLNYDIPKEINPLVDDARKRSRCVGEITDLICKLLAQRKDENHG
jgi:acyl carrier protein